MIRTKIICTAGPSVDSQKMIEALVKQGMSLIRFNCSHGNEETRLRHLKRVRRVEKKLGKPIGVMIDLQGPKLRVGDLPETFVLKNDEVWKLAYQAVPDATKKIIPISFKDISKGVKVGGRLFMDDGLIRTHVVRKSKQAIWIKVVNGGQLRSRVGINIPYFDDDHTVLTAKDKKDLLWGLKQEVDFVALSFVRHAQDILLLKKLIQKHKTEELPLVIAKIEKPEAVDDMDEIIEVSDGILVARGDLGIELSFSQVPVVQKQLIEKCRLAKKPVIIATQMLDSMRINPIPTRAEVSDVASAIYAGTDAVMLTGETSIGNHPIQATAMMQKIIRDVENHMIKKDFRKTRRDFHLKDRNEAFMFNVMQLADDIKARVIVILTKKGYLTRLISKLHPKQPVFSLALNQMSYRHMTLFWGIFPINTPMRVVGKRIDHGIRTLKDNKVVKQSDQIIFVYRDYKSDNLNLKVVKV